MPMVPGAALAQGPNQPADPPPQAIYCARPALEDVTDELTVPPSFAVELDEELGKARITISELPANATCYAIDKTPSGGSNPIAFAWDPVAVAAPGEFLDDGEFSPGPGEYCYELVLGNPAGRSAPEVRCITVPLSVSGPAPTPPIPAATPATPSLGPPAAGSGLVDSHDGLGAPELVLHHARQRGRHRRRGGVSPSRAEALAAERLEALLERGEEAPDLVPI